MGNLGEFVTDQISLYYFSDVPRLMRVLNPAARPINSAEALRLQGEVKATRRRLDDADLARMTAQNQINDLQVRVRKMREDLRIARSRQQNDALSLRNAAHVREARDRDNDKVKDGTDAAAKEKAKERLRVAQENENDFRSASDKSTKQLTDLQSENDDLPTRITASETELSQAQSAVDRARTEGNQVAQEDVAAFAALRDNASFLQADADASSSDPAKRVLLYAFADSKTIFMRGKPDDVAEVKSIIARFDQPVPQARLTLWTQELSGQANVRGFKKFNQQLAKIDMLLSDTRARIAASETLLKEALHEQVVAAQNLPSVQNKAVGANDNARQRRLSLYNDEFIEIKPFLLAAGFSLPDPARTTTLGETLLVLAMAKKTYASTSFASFEKKLSVEMFPASPDKNKKSPPLEYPSRDFLPEEPEFYPSPARGQWFAGLKRVLGLSSALSDDTTASSAQMEIRDALFRKALERIAENIEIRRYDSLRLKEDWDKRKNAATLVSRSTTASPAEKANAELAAAPARNEAVSSARQGLLDTWNTLRGIGFTKAQSVAAGVDRLPDRSPQEVSNFLNDVDQRTAGKAPDYVENPRARDFAALARQVAVRIALFEKIAPVATEANAASADAAYQVSDKP